MSLSDSEKAVLRGRLTEEGEELPVLPSETSNTRLIHWHPDTTPTDGVAFYQGNPSHLPGKSETRFETAAHAIRELEEPDIELDARQAVCGVCNLVYWKPLGHCSNCSLYT